MTMREIRKAAIHRARVLWLCAGEAWEDKALAAGRRWSVVKAYCIRRHGDES